MSSTAFDPPQVRALLDAAERAYSQGQVAEATRLLAAARSNAPEDAEVFSASGIHALRVGNAAEAKALIGCAIKFSPSNPRFYLNLSACLRQLKDADGELKALNEALALDPYLYLANFQKGSLYESQGKPILAVGCYQACLSSLQPGAAVQEAVVPLLEHARRAVLTNAVALDTWLQERLRPARERHAGAAQDRVDDCLAVFLGKKRVFVQRPTMTHFPRLPAIPFFDRRDFPWIGAVENATDDIRRELMELLKISLQDFSPYVAYAPDVPLNQWKELNQSRRWSALFLYQDGRRIENNIERCPLTAAALARAPLVEIANTAPTAFFSRLEPKTRIPPHTGSSNTRLTVHIPLIVPPGCGFRVGSEVREWQPGTALIFDDTIEHAAWNDSDEPRVIMIFDIWNPLLTPAERELMSVATSSIAEYYRQEQ